jgi:hypothetical protein
MSHIKDFIADLELGEPKVSGSLTMYPLLTRQSNMPGYVTLDQALEAGIGRVEEVSEGGSVPELLFRNDGDTPILLLDGEELVGAKQNRILNLSILVPARTALKIPVSCVEANRWAYRSRNFKSSDRAYHASGRAEKVAHVSASMAVGAPPRSNQGAVWASVAQAAKRFGVRSPTAAMSDVFEERRPSIDRHVERLAAVHSRQAGAVFIVDGRIAGLDLFESPATYARLAPKLIRSYALESGDSARNGAGAPAAGEVKRLLQSLAGASAQRFKAVGLGEDWRLHGNNIKGAALVHEESGIHICAFAS